MIIDDTIPLETSDLEIDKEKAIKSIDISKRNNTDRNSTYSEFDLNFKFDANKTEIRATPLLAEYSKKSPVNAAAIKEDVGFFSEAERVFGKMKNAPDKQVVSGRLNRNVFDLMMYDNGLSEVSNIKDDVTRSEIVDSNIEDEMTLGKLSNYDKEDDFYSDVPAGVVSVLVQIADAVKSQPKAVALGGVAGSPLGPIGAATGGIMASSAVDNFQITAGSIYKESYLDLPKEERGDQESAFRVSLAAGAVSGGLEFLPVGKLLGKLTGGVDLSKIPKSKVIDIIKNKKGSAVYKAFETLGKAIYEQGLPEYAQGVTEEAAKAINDPNKEVSADILKSKEALLGLVIGTAADVSFTVAPTVAKTTIGSLRKFNESLGEQGAAGSDINNKGKKFNIDSKPTKDVQFILNQKIEEDKNAVKRKTENLKKIIDLKNKTSVKGTEVANEVETIISSNEVNYVSQQDLQKMIEKDNSFKNSFERITGQTFDENKSLYTVSDKELLNLHEFNEDILNNYTIQPEGNSIKTYEGFTQAVEKNKEYFKTVVTKLENPDLTPEERDSLNSEMNDVLNSSMESVYSPESRLDQPIFPQSVKELLPESEVAQLELDLRDAQTKVAESVVDARQKQVDKIVSLDTRVEMDNRIAIIEDSLLKDEKGVYTLEQKFDPESIPSSDSVNVLRSLDPKFENASPELIIDDIKAKHSKPGFSVFAIDPATLPENLKGSQKIKRMKDKKVFVKGGLDYNQLGPVANALGFDTPLQMLQNLSKQPTRQESLLSLADDALKIQYQLSFNEFGADKDDFLDAFKNKAKIHLKEIKVVLTEKTGAAKKLIKRLGRDLKTIESIEAQSKAIVRKLKVRELKPEIYRRNQDNFLKRASDALASGDFLEFFSNKEKQALNSLIEGDVQKASRVINSKMQRVAKLFRKESQKKLSEAGQDFVDLFNSLKDVIVFNPEKKPVLQEKLKIMEPYIAAGYAVPEALIATINDTKVHMSDMTYDQTVAVLDTMLDIYNAALESRRVFKAEEAMDILNIEEIAADELQGRADYNEENYKEFKQKDNRPKGWLRSTYDSISDRLGTYGHSIRTYSQIISSTLDLGNVSGIWSRILVDPIIKSETDRSNSNKTWGDFLNKLSEKSTIKSYSKETVVIPEFSKKFNGGVVTKGELIGMMGQLGSITGRAALQKDMEMSPDSIKNIIERHTTKEDAKIVQSIFNYFEKVMWPNKVKALRDSGLALPEKTLSDPFKIHGLDITGGYFPITRRQDMVEKARHDARDWSEILEEGNIIDSLFTSAINTFDGHNLERVKNATSPIDYSFDALEFAVQQMNHNNAFAKTLRDIGKVLSNSAIQRDIINIMGMKNLTQILQHLESVAHSKGEMSSIFEQQVNKDMNQITSNLYVYTMGLKLSTFGKQYLSLFPMVNDLANQTKSKSKLKVIQNLAGVLFDRGLFNPREFVRNLQHVAKRDSQIQKQLNDISNNNPGFLNNILEISRSFELDNTKSSFSNVLNQVKSLTLQHLSVAQLYLNMAQYITAYKMALDGEVDGVNAGDVTAAEVFASKSVKYSLSDTSKLNEPTIYKNAFGRFSMFAGRQMLLSANAMVSAVTLSKREMKVTPQQKSKSLLKATGTIISHSVAPTLAIILFKEMYDKITGGDEEDKENPMVVNSKENKKEKKEIKDYTRQIGLSFLDYFPVTKDIKYGVESALSYPSATTRYPNIYMNLAGDTLGALNRFILALSEDKVMTKKDAKKLVDVTSMWTGVPNAGVGTMIDKLIDVTNLPEKSKVQTFVGGESESVSDPFFDSIDTNKQEVPSNEEEKRDLIDYLKESIEGFTKDSPEEPVQNIAKAMLRKSIGDISNPEVNKINYVQWADEDRTKRINLTIDLTEKDQEDLMIIVDTISRLETDNHTKFANPNSSAKGYHQFLDNVWSSLIRKYPELELGKTPLETSKAKQYQAYWKFLGENLALLNKYDQPWTMENIYIAHFLGASEYPSFNNASGNQNIMTPEFTAVTSANPLFFKGRSSMTKDQFIKKVRDKMNERLPDAIDYALSQNLLTSG